MFFILRLELFALLVEELRAKCAVNTAMSIPSSSMNVLIYLAIVADEIGLYGNTYDIINCLSFPVERSLSSNVRFLYSSMQTMIQIFVFSGNFVDICGS